MILSDSQILSALGANDIVISPFAHKQLGPNSYDVRLAPTLIRYTDQVLDPKRINATETIEIPETGKMLLPGEFYLGATAEVVGSRKYVAFLDGKSSLGRLGVFVHVTAGRGDVGFVNHWTLEICVVKPIVVYPLMPIAQFIFHEAGPCRIPYDRRPGSKYVEGTGAAIPVPSAMWKNFEEPSKPVARPSVSEPLPYIDRSKDR